jgi:hypothetical protein
MERRKFVPDVKAIADQLIADYRHLQLRRVWRAR